MDKIQEKKNQILNDLYKTKDGLTWNETTEMLNDLIEIVKCEMSGSKINESEFILYVGTIQEKLINNFLTEEGEPIEDIKLYCANNTCTKYIKGKQGYNGKFRAESGHCCDLRNQSWYCTEHEPEAC